MDADKQPPETPKAATSWKGAFRQSNKRTDDAPSQSWGRVTWRRSSDTRFERKRLNWLFFRRIGLTLAALALIATLIWVLFSIKHRVPLIVGFATSYTPPLSPVVLSQEDRDLLQRLSISGRVFRPASVVWHDASDHVQSGHTADIVKELAAAVGQARPGGPGNDMIFVYLAMTGTLDREGRPCLIPPVVADVPAADESLNYIRVDRLLGELRNVVRPGTGIVLVLDACRTSLNWPLGVGDGGFSMAVESMFIDTKMERTWVLLPAGAGQLAHAHPSDAALRAVWIEATRPGAEGLIRAASRAGYPINAQIARNLIARESAAQVFAREAPSDGAAAAISANLAQGFALPQFEDFRQGGNIKALVLNSVWRCASISFYRSPL